MSSFDETIRKDILIALGALNMISNIKHGIETTREDIMDAYETLDGRDSFLFYTRLRDEVMIQKIVNEDLASSIARLSIMLFEAEDALDGRQKR